MTAAVTVQSPRRIGIAELEQRINLERSTIWRWYVAGRFPRPHYIGTRRCWWLDEIEAWEVEQMASAAPRAVGVQRGGA